MCVCVVKVGGSLFDFPQLPSALAEWLDTQSTSDTLLIAGGGRLADAVRDVDRRFRLDRHVAHWLAIRAMAMNTEVLGHLIPDLRTVKKIRHWYPAMCHGEPPRRWLLDVELFLREEEPEMPGRRLPVGWHVTSDSVAARIAEVTGAMELVLLKSSLPQGPQPRSRQQAARHQYVDAQFPTAAASIPTVRVVNLRADAFPEMTLDAAGTME